MEKILSCCLTVIIGITTIASCRSTKPTKKDFIGEYKYRTNKIAYNFDYKLILNEDTTFFLQIGSGRCSGKWYKYNNEIRLSCDEEGTLSAISSGNLSQREYTVTELEGDSLSLLICEQCNTLPVLPPNTGGGKKIIILKKNTIPLDVLQERF